MKKLLERMLPGKKAEPAPVQLATAGSAYRAELITQLKDDHQELLKIYGHIGAIMEKYPEMPTRAAQHIGQCLSQFRTLFFDHITLENGPLYNHIRMAYKSDQETVDMVNQFKKDMGQIQKAVTHFLVTWRADAIAKNPQEFKQHYSKVGKALTHRIGREEKRLYIVYDEIPNMERMTAPVK